MKHLKTYKQLNEEFMSKKRWNKNDEEIEIKQIVTLIKQYVKDNWDNEDVITNPGFGGTRMTKLFPLKKGYYIDYFRDVRGDLYELMDENDEKMIAWVHNKHPFAYSDIDDVTKHPDFKLSVAKFLLN